jgi:hypothetical protein
VAVLWAVAGHAWGVGDGLQATYYDQPGQQQYFTGSTVVRVDPQVDFDWGGGSPAPGIGNNDFSVRWTGQVEAPASGDYTFYTQSDDGVRLWVDNTLVINNWTDHAQTEDASAVITLTAGTRYSIRMEFYERAGQAVARLLWSGPGIPKQVIPQSQLYSADNTPPALDSASNACGVLDQVQVVFSEAVDSASATDVANYAIDNGAAISSATLAADSRTVTLDTSTLIQGTTYTVTVDNVQDVANPSNAIAPNSQVSFTAQPGTLSSGLLGTYFDQNGQPRAYFGGNTVSRVDPQVNFNWGNGAPAAGIGSDDFSVRWSGLVEAPRDGNFQFFTTSDDGVRLWVDGVLVIDNWTDHGPVEDGSGPVSLTGGARYAITMEYYERDGGAVAELRWRGPGISKQIIPQGQLFHCTAPTLDHFTIGVGAGSASTCAPQSITVTAEDSANNAVSDYTGTVALATSSGHGDWSTVTANGTLGNGSTDDGSASYTFVGSDAGTIVLALDNTHADDLTIAVQDGTLGVGSTSSALSFRDNAFVIIPTDALGTEAVAGRAHGLQAALWRKDPSSGNCAVATDYAGTQNLKAWLTRDVEDPSGAAPSIAGIALPDTQPGAPNLQLDFSAGVAALALSSTDVGKYALNLRDEASGFARDAAGNPLPVDGSSPTLTVRPFGLAVGGVQAGATSNPGASTPGGGVFTSAGSDFTATVTGVLWQAADDGNGDGVPDAGASLSDNVAAPSYDWATTLTAAAPFEPASGVLGTLTNGLLPQGSFSNGSASASTLRYGEVGSFTLDASATSFLNTPGVDVGGSAGVVGRFTPFDFSVALNAPQFGTACGSFTYVGQPFAYTTQPVLTVAARNRAGATTRNYTGAWWKITDAKLAADGQKSYAAATGSLDLGLAPTPDPVIVDAGGGTGTLTFDSGGGISFLRGPPTAPFDAEISLSIKVLDEDDIACAANPVKFGDASPGNGVAFSSGKTMRWGRLALRNASGSERLPVVLPAEAQYYDGAGFVINSDDNCSALGVGQLVLSNDIQPSETDGDIAIAASSTTAAIANSPFAGGDAALSFSAPGTGNTGYADVTAELGPLAADLPWLQYDWDGDGNQDNNPSARATFGIFQGSDVVIQVREPWY